MGKILMVQRRGKGSIYKAPSHRYVADVKYPSLNSESGIVKKIINDPSRTGPLMVVDFKGKSCPLIAPERIAIGDKIDFCGKTNGLGSIQRLQDISEGTPVFNVEIKPGDGGKLIRSAGTYATITGKDEKNVVLKLPSGKLKTVNLKCRATIGVVGGGGRNDKPLLKAGKKKLVIKNKPKIFPVVSGVAKNPVDHPHGGGAHQHVGKSKTPGRNAPPGRKVGSIAAKRTGKKR